MSENAVVRSGIMTDSEGKKICLAVPCIETICIHCKNPIEQPGQNVLFYALGEPYCAAVHFDCMPFYKYDGIWPHKFPLCAYLRKSS